MKAIKRQSNLFGQESHKNHFADNKEAQRHFKTFALFMTTMKKFLALSLKNVKGASS